MGLAEERGDLKSLIIIIIKKVNTSTVRSYPSIIIIILFIYLYFVRITKELQLRNPEGTDETFMIDWDFRFCHYLAELRILYARTRTKNPKYWPSHVISWIVVFGRIPDTTVPVPYWRGYGGNSNLYSVQ